MKPKKMMYRHEFPALEWGKFVRKQELFPVVVMAIAGVYAMVRRKGAVPFVVSVADLSEIEGEE
jgi:hypothetical protein